jgi:hypothetical protein
MLPSVFGIATQPPRKVPGFFQWFQAYANPQAVSLFDKHTRSQGPFLAIPKRKKGGPWYLRALEICDGFGFCTNAEALSADA